MVGWSFGFGSWFFLRLRRLGGCGRSSCARLFLCRVWLAGRRRVLVCSCCSASPLSLGGVPGLLVGWLWCGWLGLALSVWFLCLGSCRFGLPAAFPGLSLRLFGPACWFVLGSVVVALWCGVLGVGPRFLVGSAGVGCGFGLAVFFFGWARLLLLLACGFCLRFCFALPDGLPASSCCLPLACVLPLWLLWVCGWVAVASRRVGRLAPGASSRSCLLCCFLGFFVFVTSGPWSLRCCGCVCLLPLSAPLSLARSLACACWAFWRRPAFRLHLLPCRARASHQCCSCCFWALRCCRAARPSPCLVGLPSHARLAPACLCGPSGALGRVGSAAVFWCGSSGPGPFASSFVARCRDWLGSSAPNTERCPAPTKPARVCASARPLRRRMGRPARLERAGLDWVL